MSNITGTAGNDTITGTTAADEIYGGDGNDTITGGLGNDVIYGGKGTDTVSYSGAYGNFKLTALYEGKNGSFSGFTVADLSGSEGTDTVNSDVEYLTFSSGSVIYKIDNGAVSLVDTTAPTIAITSSNSSLSASQTATITFTLSESSSNFAVGDVTVSGGTLSNFSGSGTTYTALFTPTANSTTSGVVRVASSVFSDAAGNLNADGSDANNTVTMTVNTVADTTAPTVAVSSSATSLSASQTATITFTLSESSSNFAVGDVTASGGTLSNFSGSGTTYTALFTPTANSTTSGVVSIGNGVFSDAAGNVNADGSDANNTVTMSVNTVPADTTAPTVAVTSSATSLSASQTATITFALSESSSNFAVGDVTVSGGTLSNFSGSGTTYTALFTPTANSTTSGVVRVASSVFSDAAGNLNADGSDANNTVTMSVNTVPVGKTYVGTTGNDIISGTSGNDTLDGGVGTDTVSWTQASSNYQLTSTASGWKITDKTGADGTDTVTNIEKLQFSDRTVIVESQSHGSYSALPTELYQFFITAFNAAPGVTYMDQLAEAYNYGLSVESIVNIFTTKTQFTDVYPTSLSHVDLATQLVTNIVKSSATTAAKTEAIADIKGALDLGWTVGKVIYTVFGNLAKKSLTDSTWGGTAQQFNNEIAVAKYYTETLNQSTTDLETLRDAIQPVTQSTDVSSNTVVAQLIGVALMTGGLGS